MFGYSKEIKNTQITGIETFKKSMNDCHQGENVGLLLRVLLININIIILLLNHHLITSSSSSFLRESKGKISLEDK